MEHEKREFWATRSGRWRLKLKKMGINSFAENLASIIEDEIHAGQLPTGALIPSAMRVGQELKINSADVEMAYTNLLNDGLLDPSPDGSLRIARYHEEDVEQMVVSETQFQKRLVELAKRAKALGMDPREATGLFMRVLEEQD